MAIIPKFKHGGVTYPLVASTNNDLLKDADPGVYYALQLFESVLNTYVGPRLLAQAALESLNFPSAVEKTLHVEPTPFLLADQLVFPLFCLYRSEEQWAEQNVSSSRDNSIWDWAYVLPPLTPRQIEQLNPILRSVAVTVSSFAMQSFDPDYEGGNTLRELSGIQRMVATSVRYGNFEPVDTQDRFWRAVTGRLLVTEKGATALEALDTFEGVDAAIDETSPDGTQLVGFVEVATPPDLTITGVSPASGTKAGGAVLLVDGVGFQPGRRPPKVLVGGAYASNVVVLHPTRIQCLTPEHEAFPTFAADVQVIGADGQESNVLAGAYTFTTP